MTKLKSWHLDRRTILRGAGGLALGLPFLESMQGQASTADELALPKRVACFFFPNGVALPPANSEFHSDWHWFPQGTGVDYKLNKSTQSFERHRSKMTILSGLSHPSGRHMAGHGVSDVYLTAGPVDANSYQNTISMDQVIADRIGRDTRIQSLALSTGGGVGTTGRTHTLSFTKTGQPIPAENNIRRCFNMLFGNDSTSLQDLSLIHI